MEPVPNNPSTSYFTPSMSMNIFQLIRNFMNLIRRLHSDFQQGNSSASYSVQEFSLPNALIDLIKDSVKELEGSYLLIACLSILKKTNPTDSLISAFMQSFYIAADKIDDLNVVQWVIMCCLVSIVLHDKGFTAAPELAINTLGGVVCMHERWNAFKRFGCMI